MVKDRQGMTGNLIAATLREPLNMLLLCMRHFNDGPSLQTACKGTGMCGGGVGGGGGGLG